eukprot:s3490_g11.t1
MYSSRALSNHPDLLTSLFFGSTGACGAPSELSWAFVPCSCLPLSFVAAALVMESSRCLMPLSSAVFPALAFGSTTPCRLTDPMQVELPGHMYLAALEEHLLLAAYRKLSGTYVGAACPPVVTLASHNDLIALATEHLDAGCLDAFLIYAEQLCHTIRGNTLVDLPPPLGPLRCG